jgi:hypothetical protein
MISFSVGTVAGGSSLELTLYCILWLPSLKS